MTTFYQLDIAACVLATVILLIVFLRRSYPTVQRRLFKAAVIVNIFNTAIEIVSVFTWEKVIPANSTLYFIVNILNIIIHSTLHLVFIYYIIALCRGGKILKPERIIIATFYLAIMIFVATTPFHKLVFYFDENMKYAVSFGEYIVAIFDIGTTIYAIVLSIKYKDRLGKTQTGLIATFITALIAAIIVELSTNMGILVENFTITVSFCLLNIVFDNPYQYFVPKTNYYNDHTFRIVYEERFKQKQGSKLIFFTYKDFELTSEIKGKEISTEIVNKTLELLVNAYSRANVFSLGRNVFAVDIKNLDFEKEVLKINALAFKVNNIFNNRIKLDPYYGCISIPQDADNVDDLLDAIYITMFDTNKTDQFITYFDKKYLEKLHREQHIIMKIHEAIEHDGFEIYYQPFYNWKSRRYVGLEALLRFKHVEGEEIIGPGEFIPIAENNGLIYDIDEIVFEKVCRFIRNSSIKDYGIKFIDINLSLYKLMDPATVDRYTELASRYEVDPSFINLEITETAEGDEKYLSLIRANIAKFREKGFNFSLDDYGSGYSTVIYMAEMDTNLVKIDASILWNAVKNKKYYTVLENCVRLVYCFDKECLVEGVETEEMVKLLQRLGVGYFQGYYYSKPLPELSILDFLAKNNKIGGGLLKSQTFSKIS